MWSCLSWLLEQQHAAPPGNMYLEKRYGKKKTTLSLVIPLNLHTVGVTHERWCQTGASLHTLAM